MLLNNNLQKQATVLILDLFDLINKHDWENRTKSKVRLYKFAWKLQNNFLCSEGSHSRTAANGEVRCLMTY